MLDLTGGVFGRKDGPLKDVPKLWPKLKLPSKKLKKELEENRPLEKMREKHKSKLKQEQELKKKLQDSEQRLKLRQLKS